MISSLLSLGILGIEGYAVTVETFLASGLPSFEIVGLPDASVREARERVRAAMKTGGYDFPTRRITVNLAPADTKKEGPVYDLPIFLGILAASEQFPMTPPTTAFVGELALSGELRPLNGVLSMAMAARDTGVDTLFLPLENASEAALVDGLTVYGARFATDIIDHFNGVGKLTPAVPPNLGITAEHPLDFADVKGQEGVKRALVVAAAGGHNILLSGPPGSGKSMLARRLPSILPAMTREEALEATKIHSVSGVLPADRPLLGERPFRSPHHSVSAPGLTGGGRTTGLPRPGEFSLAHNGVLFMDEFPEYNRLALESLRQPLEDGSITLTRVAGTVTYPADFMLVCAMNPCKCGWLGHPTRPCVCSDATVGQYRNRLSGPILDRIDIRTEVPALQFDELSQRPAGRTSADLRADVEAARRRARERYKDYGITCNAKLPPTLVARFCVLDEAGTKLIKAAFDKLGLTARSYDRILRLARTIADLEGVENITPSHIAEALQYRGNA